MPPQDLQDNEVLKRRVDPESLGTGAGRVWRTGALVVVFVYLLMVQGLTGVLLMTVYAPSTTNAWGSVWYLQTQVPGGWFIRGLHHVTSNAMLIVMAVQLLSWIAAATYRSMRWSVWAIALLLLALTLAISLTGELLPWDQEGYWGTKVRLNILAQTPVVGEMLRRLLTGGNDLGTLTLTRFYTLHIVALPALMILLLFWRARLTRTSERFSREHSLRRSIAAAIAIAAIAAVVCIEHSAVWLAEARTDADATLISDASTWLSAPADPAATDYPARPEWHTLFLYQWFKRVGGHGDGSSPALKVVGTFVVPGLIVAMLLGLPVLDRGGPRRGGDDHGEGLPTRAGPAPRAARFFVLGFTSLLVLGIGYLHYEAMRADANPTDADVARVTERKAAGEALSASEHAVLRARAFRRQRENARRQTRRTFELAAREGIPPTGPLELLARDPLTRGPILFAQHCASCHRVHGHDGLGGAPADPPTSSDLAGFGTKEWIRGLLEDPMNERYFGRMKKPDGDPAHTRMSRFVREIRGDQDTEENRHALMADFDAVAAYLEEEGVHPGRTTPGDPLVRKGREFFMATCNECHSYDRFRSGTLKAPEMLGYGSVAWIEGIIGDASHDTRYRNRGREPAQMPPFKDRLSPLDRRLIAEWFFLGRTESKGAP